MRLHAWYCDWCGEAIDETEGHNCPTTISAVRGTHWDGVETVNDCQYRHLCEDCLTRELQRFLSEMSHEEAAEWLDRPGWRR